MLFRRQPPSGNTWDTKPPSAHHRMPRIAFTLVSILVLLATAGGTLFSLHLIPSSIAHAAGETAVTTYKNDNARDGLNSNETTLNQSNVNKDQFGKRVTYPVDGQIYAHNPWSSPILRSMVPHIMSSLWKPNTIASMHSMPIRRRPHSHSGKPIISSMGQLQ